MKVILVVMFLSVNGFAQSSSPHLIDPAGILDAEPQKATEIVVSGVPKVTATLAVGSGRLAEINTNQVGKSPFEKLRQFFNESNTAAKLSDFPLGIHYISRRQTCVTAKPYSVRTAPIWIARAVLEVDRTVEEPGQGPLLPGKPAQPGKILNFLFGLNPDLPRSIHNDNLSNEIEQIARNETFISSPSELIVTLQEPDQTFYVRSRYRKNGGLIVFDIEQNGQGIEPSDSLSYGYCWK